ncbi:MAG: LuxR C-terminal-related transcriptional regulator [Anaerolineae bacterium]
MATTLLNTKLYIPPARPDLVPRPRLIEQLNACLGQSPPGFGRKLSLICAPAGFGKTTLLIQWIRACSRLEPQVAAAWLSLDRGDNDPNRFWTYVIAALQTIHPSVGQSVLAMLQSPQPPSMHRLLSNLLNDIAEIPEPAILVLDDVHKIKDRRIHEELAFLLDHQPPQMHLVIATRADPHLPVARLRANGQLTELRQADLRFTVEEVTVFLDQVMDLELSSDDVTALDVRIEGWIAGLRMAAISMRERRRTRGVQDVSGFIKGFTGSHRFILDYLAEEVLGQQPPAIQEFLLKTSILRQMTAPLCNSVTGKENSQETLDYLDQAGLFAVPLDDDHCWYRYHGLFADLLRNRLLHTLPGTVPELHRRASTWYEQNGFVTEGIGHALSGGNFERVERLIADQVLAMIYHGASATLLGWLEAIPHQVVRSRPWLCVAYAWVLILAGQPGNVETRLQDAEEALDRLESVGRRRTAGHIAAIRAHVSGQKRENTRSLALAREALEHLPEEDQMARSFATAVAGEVLEFSGDLEAAAQAATEAVALAQAADADYMVMDICGNLVRLQMWQGQLRQAATTCREALRLAKQSVGPGGRPLPISGYVSAWLSRVLCEWNDLEAALRYAKDGLEVCRRWGQTTYLAFVYATMAKTLQATGDADGALEAFQQARQLAADLPPPVIALGTAWEMQIRLAQGDAEAAWRWAQASGLSVDDELVFHRYEEYRTFAQALIAQTRPDDALALLARLLEMVEAVGAWGNAIDMLVLQAMALQAKGQVDEALTTLKGALSLAEPEGYVRTFIDQGASMGRLLQQAIARGIAVDYAGRLLAASASETKDSKSLPSSDLVEPLSERELEVLWLLTTTLTAPEIADELVISVSTVRSHVQSIYRKLDVHRRFDAVQRARELNLL